MSNGGRIAPQLAKLSCDAAPSKVEHDIAVKSTVSQLKLLVVGSFLLFVEASFLRGSSLSSWKLPFFVEAPFSSREASFSSWESISSHFFVVEFWYSAGGAGRASGPAPAQ